MKVLKIIPLALLFLIVFSCHKEHIDNGCYIEIPKDIYNYPMTPSSSDWAKYYPIEIWSMDQLPEDVINKISTPGLLETCILFPYYGDIGLTDSPQFGFNYFKNNFNGCHELLQRDDSPEVIFDRYKSMNPLCEINNYPDFLGRGRSVGMAFMAIEMILAQYDILNKFNDEQLNIVANESLLKCDQKGQSYYVKFTLLICGRILKIENYQPFIDLLDNNSLLQVYIDEGQVEYQEILDLVKEQTINYLNTN